MVQKALFKIGDDELTFCKVVEVATETEDAAKGAKEIVLGSRPTPNFKMDQKKAKKVGRNWQVITFVSPRNMLAV